MKTMSEDIEAELGEAKASVRLWTCPSDDEPDTSELWVSLHLPGQGEYEYAIRDSEGQTIRTVTDKGDVMMSVSRGAAFKTPAKGESLRYTFEVSFTPYRRYQDTRFGPKLLEGPDGGPLPGRRQELKRELIIENTPDRTRRKEGGLARIRED